MVKVLEISGGHIIARKPSGQEVFNSAKPMPVTPDASTWQASFRDVPLNFTVGPASGYLVGSTIYFRWNPQNKALTQAVLGAYPAGMPLPDFIFGKLRAKRTGGLTLGNTDKTTGYMLCYGTGAFSRWTPFSGSVLMEWFFNDNDPMMGSRYCNVAVEDGSWVLNGWTSNQYIEATAEQFTLLVDYVFDIDLTWGIFK